MIPNRRRFEVSFPAVPRPVVDVWRSLISVLATEKCLPNRFDVQQITGHSEEYHSTERLRLTPDEIERLILERDLTGFFVDTGNSSRSVCYSLKHPKEAGQQSLLACRVEAKSKALNDWTPVIEAMMTQWPCIGGWQWQSLYSQWQNTGVLKYYEQWFGPKPPGLRTYKTKALHEGEADREFPDNSSNPGRTKEILPTVNFCPTAEMWLGPHFWQYAKCTKEEALAADFFLEQRDTPHFLYLKSWPEPFSRPDGEQGRQQQRLWKLFFNEDCEWPPGSGGVSEEPVYGPPELMPKSE